MTLSTVGVRHWAQAMWRRTLGTLRVEAASRWPVRLQASLPVIGPGRDWQSALGMALSAGSAGDDEASGRRHVPHRAVMADAAAPRRHPMPLPPAEPGRSASSTGTARWLRPRGRVRPPDVSASRVPPARAIDSHVLGAILGRHRIATAHTTPRLRASALDLPRHARHEAAHAAPAPPVPFDRAEWPRLLARHTANRLAALPAAGGTRRVDDRPGLESRLADALARTLDAAVQGVRADAVVLRDSAQRRAHARVDAPWPTADTWHPGSDALSDASQRLPPDAVHETARRARTGRPEPAASAEHATRLRGATPDVAPWQPLGFQSAWSAPAPDAAVSVVPGPAGSVTRVSPPTGVPSLPPLMPAAVTQPPALGISAPGLRLATRAEDADVDDGDTSRLADRIRGILRDEARRHGITLP